MAEPIPSPNARQAVAKPIMLGVGTFLLVAGFALMVLSGYTAVHKYRRMREWIPVDALVLDFQLRNEPHGRVTTDYRAHFTFRYEVSGQTRVASAESDYTTSLPSELRAWRQAYAPGHRRQIRYNPEHPEQITTDDLNLRSFRQPLWVGGWGLGMLVIGLILRH